MTLDLPQGRHFLSKFPQKKPARHTKFVFKKKKEIHKTLPKGKASCNQINKIKSNLEQSKHSLQIVLYVPKKLNIFKARNMNIQVQYTKQRVTWQVTVAAYRLGRCISGKYKTIICNDICLLK